METFYWVFSVYTFQGLLLFAYLNIVHVHIKLEKEGGGGEQNKYLLINHT